MGGGHLSLSPHKAGHSLRVGLVRLLPRECRVGPLTLPPPFLFSLVLTLPAPGADSHGRCREACDMRDCMPGHCPLPRAVRTTATYTAFKLDPSGLGKTFIRSNF